MTEDESITLDNVKWKPIILKELAEVELGIYIFDYDRIPGNTPYASACSVNNGVGFFVGNNNETLESGCIQVNRNGSVGFAAYHPYPALYSYDCRKIRPFYHSKYYALFLTNQIMMQKGKYGYGYKMGTYRLRKQAIIMPVDEEEKPNYLFMEQYTKKIEKNLLDKYLEFAHYRLKDCKSHLKRSELRTVNDRAWKEFQAFSDGNILEIHTTNSSIDAIKLKDGSDEIVPYITRTGDNNGITKFVSTSNCEIGKDVGGTITVGLDTQTAFYQPHYFVTGQNIHIVSSKHLNQYTAQFFVVVLRDQMRAKFNWGGNGATLGRMKRLKIMLPVNDVNEPDYEFMEQYVISKEIEMLERYIQYIEER